MVVHSPVQKSYLIHSNIQQGEVLDMPEGNCRGELIETIKDDSLLTLRRIINGGVCQVRYGYQANIGGYILIHELTQRKLDNYEHIAALEKLIKAGI